MPFAETGPASFADIAGHWAEKAINDWTTRELAGGYPDGTFRPDASITRAEFVALVNRAFGYTELATGQALGTASSATFNDVAATDWYAGEIAQAAAAVGYIGGYPDGTVKPHNPVTRQEVSVMLSGFCLWTAILHLATGLSMKRKSRHGARPQLLRP